MIFSHPPRFLPQRLPRFSLLALLLVVTLLSLICAELSIERRRERAAHRALARQLERLNLEIKKNLDDYINFSRSVGVQNARSYRFGTTGEEALELQIRVDELKHLQTAAIELNVEFERMAADLGSK
jgi:hypothetical protein